MTENELTSRNAEDEFENIYFTYGSSGQDFSGGWTRVVATDLRQAIALFRMYHPDHNGFIHCCSMYREDDFKKTKMYSEGNFGKFENEVIGLYHEVKA